MSIHFTISTEVLSAALASAEQALEKADRLDWHRVQRAAFRQAFVAAFLGRYSADYAEGRSEEQKRWRDILASATDECRAEVVALAGTGISAAEAEPIVAGLRASAGMTGRA